MNTVLFVNPTIGFSENLFLVLPHFFLYSEHKSHKIWGVSISNVKLPLHLFTVNLTAIVEQLYFNTGRNRAK